MSRTAIRLNLFAYTQTKYHGYPGYVSLNLSEGQDAELTVRSSGGQGTQVATCPVPEDQLVALRDAITRHLESKARISPIHPGCKFAPKGNLCECKSHGMSEEASRACTYRKE